MKKCCSVCFVIGVACLLSCARQPANEPAPSSFLNIIELTVDGIKLTASHDQIPIINYESTMTYAIQFTPLALLPEDGSYYEVAFGCLATDIFTNQIAWQKYNDGNQRLSQSEQELGETRESFSFSIAPLQRTSRPEACRIRLQKITNNQRQGQREATLAESAIVAIKIWQPEEDPVVDEGS